MILALDPGGTTGVAWWHDHLGYQGEEVAGGFEGALDFLRHRVTWDQLDVVVVEGFVIHANTHKMSPEGIRDTLDIIGMVRGFCLVAGVERKLYFPQDKAFGTDTKLKALGWYTPTKGGHRNDAARHLLKYLVAVRREPSILKALVS